MPRVAYALSRPFTPAYEAVSRQIAVLGGGEAGRPVVGVLPLRSAPLHWRRGAHWLEAHPLLLRWRRGLGRLWSDSQLLHVFAPLPLPRRLHALVGRFEGPAVLTAISLDSRRLDPTALDPFDRVVVECERDREELLGRGLAVERLELVRPGSGGLDRETPPPPPDGPLTVLFASWPFQADEATARGVDLLVEAAARLPELRLRVLRRPGSRVPAARYRWPKNCTVEDGVVEDFAALLAQVHAVVAPFRPGCKAKSVPNSLIEGLALGRPAVLSRAVGLAALLEREGAGVVYDGGVEGLVEALQRLQSGHAALASAAFACGRRHFTDALYRERSEAIYAALLGRTSPQSQGSVSAE